MSPQSDWATNAPPLNTSLNLMYQGTPASGRYLYSYNGIAANIKLWPQIASGCANRRVENPPKAGITENINCLDLKGPIVDNAEPQ